MENNTYQTTEQKARQIGDTVNKKAKEIGDTVKEKIEGTDASEWMNAISQMLEKLAEKHPKVSLECENVSFETEKPDNRGSIISEGKIKISGKFTLSLD